MVGILPLQIISILDKIQSCFAGLFFCMWSVGNEVIYELPTWQQRLNGGSLPKYNSTQYTPLG